MSSIRRAIVITALACGGIVIVYYVYSAAQQKGTSETPAVQVRDQAAMSGHAIPSSALESLQWRNIGPFRGGRASATTV